MSILLIAAAAAVIYALLGIRIAQEYERGVVFRLGRYHSVRGPGLYWIAPVLERQWSLDLRTRTVAVEQQETQQRMLIAFRKDGIGLALDAFPPVLLELIGKHSGQSDAAVVERLAAEALPHLRMAAAMHPTEEYAETLRRVAAKA